MRTLRERMTAGAVPVREAVAILRALLDAMENEQAEGGRRRTITPDAVMLEGGGRVSFPDEGAAVSRARTGYEDAYRAPELPEGEGGTTFESAERSAVYSWGVVAYELLVGIVPFATARSAEALRVAHATETPVPIAPRASGIPPALAGAVMACLAKEARERPTVAVLRDALDEVGDIPTRAPQSPWRRRVPVLALLLLIAIALVVLLGARALRG